MSIAAKPNQREHILDVALRLMSENGASNTSMRQLARECDLNVAAIYYYFESKDELLRSVIAERQYGSRLADIPEINLDDPLAKRLGIIYMATWNGAIEEESVWRLLLGEGIRGETSAIIEGQALLGLFQDGLSGWLQIAAPELEDLKTTTDLMIGQIFSGFVRKIFEPNKTQEEIARQSIETIVASVVR